MDAAYYNWSILIEKNFNLLINNKDFILNPGFKFNNLEYLAMVLDKYLSQKNLFLILTEEIKYLLQDITKNNRLIRLEENLARRKLSYKINGD